uniref:C2 domain-containing protein n=1 Tax=Neobodo designis TaxID=312471 RepID=A0A7S1L6F5_NEODS|mmetsp:Transcript_15732/g.48794  ORF Transcript_15732/g.48794 Transcript_15732/m.48794 type:complete len:605 (+) Transcript_15732:65-1879(+)
MAAYAKQAAPVPPPPPAVPAAGPASSDVTRMRLYFRAHDLMDTDTFSKSDPYVVLYHAGRSAAGVAAAQAQQQLTAVGRTEVKKDDLSPQFERSVEVDYYFETKQEFVVKVYDEDGKGDGGNDLLGTATFQLAHVVAGRGSTLEVKLSKGTLWVTAEEASTSGRDTVSLTFAGHKLKKMDLIGQSDPYYKLYRLLPNGQRKLLFQSKVIKETLEPRWVPTPAIRVSDLTAGPDAHTRCLQFECWDEDLFSDDKMGQFVCSLGELMDAAAREQAGDRQFFKLVHEKKKDKFYGNIFVARAVTTHYPTFPEYLGAGMQINLAVSIDFTGSNGDPRNPQSLHFMDPTQPNQYVRAIMSVGDILMEYDSDKMVPAFGFGAQLPLRASALGSPRAVPVTSHCFHLNGQPDPHVHDVRGILDAYALAVSSVRFSGPTYFADIIRRATAAAVASPGAYTVLLILTDGCINDTDATIDAIVDAGDAPLSIIIVGVGNADFSLMELLDGDDVRLTNRFGVSSKRDLVQFVPFHAFAAGPRWELAAEVLQEVPSQVEDWAKTHGITPDHFDAQSWAAADDEDYETRLRDVRSPSPPATIGGDRDVASHRVVSPE